MLDLDRSKSDIRKEFRFREVHIRRIQSLLACRCTRSVCPVGLLKMQVAISKMMRDDDGKFEVVSFSTNEKITKHLYDQKSYAAYTNRLAAIVGAFSLLCSVIFLATLFF